MGATAADSIRRAGGIRSVWSAAPPESARVHEGRSHLMTRALIYIFIAAAWFAAEPLRTNVFTLGPQQTHDVRSDLSHLDVSGGVAGGLIVITETGSDAFGRFSVELGGGCGRGL